MTWVRIDSITLESAAASVTFSSGLSGYKFFRLTAYIKASGDVFTMLRLNSDSGSNYTFQNITASSTTVAGARQTAAQFQLTTTNISTGETGSIVILIAKPSASVKAQITAHYGAGASPNLLLLGGEWNNTADTISGISIFPNSNNFAAGSSFLLEGLAF